MQDSGEPIEAGKAVGREREVAALLRGLEEQGPHVLFLYGIAGVGKSTLLEAFAAQARARGTTVVRIDGRDVEPTEAGFLTALGEAVGTGAALAEAVGQLARLGQRVAVTLDAYEVLRLLDEWVRSAFVAALPSHVRLVVAGREPPTLPWLSVGGFRALSLSPLGPEDAEALLVRAGMGREEARRVNRVVRGYPLGLTIAASTERLEIDVAEAAAQRVVEELTRIYLSDLDPVTRRALDAASVVRRVTLPLLASMLPEVAPQDAYDRLRATSRPPTPSAPATTVAPRGAGFAPSSARRLPTGSGVTPRTCCTSSRTRWCGRRSSLPDRLRRDR